MKNPHYQNIEFDVIVIGAGIAGIYLLHRLREVGFRVLAVEAASDVGGTWYWNRYPGARCDVDSIFYSYQFDEDLQQEWVWTARYASQPKILAYLSFVADRFNLRPHIQFNTRVQSVHYNEAKKFWRVESEGGKCVTATYCIMATGCLSIANTPNFLGLREPLRLQSTVAPPHVAGPTVGRWPTPAPAQMTHKDHCVCNLQPTPYVPPQFLWGVIGPPHPKGIRIIGKKVYMYVCI